MPVNATEMVKTAAEFARALEAHAARYEVQLPADVAARLTAYFSLVTAWNARLHLVAPTTPAEFATRHVLESLVALRFLPMGARLADVGSGAGLPAIPCLIARADLHAVLIEATQKKAVFLREALNRLHLHDRAEVCAARFEQTTAPPADFVTCRALERFTEMLPRLVAWAPPASMLLLFGGPALRAAIIALGRTHKEVQMPASDQRFLFII